MKKRRKNHFYDGKVNGEYEFWEKFVINPKICYVQDNVDINNLKIYNARASQISELIEEPFLSTVLNYRFAYQYCFHIKQYSMSEQEFEYWNIVNDLINIEGDMFDPPPGKIIGNLYNVNDPDEEVMGYFSVNGVSFKRFFANPPSLDQDYIKPRCVLGQYYITPDCLDCTTIYSSTLIKPDYWEF